MTELLELVAQVAGSDDECPFPHYPLDEEPGDNYWINNSTALGKNLATEFANGTKLYLPHLEITTIATGPSGKKNATVTYNPHHLLPGDASWPKTALKKWIDTDDGLVKFDIGYNVNCYENGIDLPSSNDLKSNWKPADGRTVGFQERYAFAAMDADGPTRQFHDAHKAYNSFAIKAMDKIAAKLDEAPAREKGCGEEDCMAGKKKPFAPPLGLMERIHATSGRLATYLHGDCTKWKMPIMTSRFALMYKTGMSQDAARKALFVKNFQY